MLRPQAFPAGAHGCKRDAPVLASGNVEDGSLEKLEIVEVAEEDERILSATLGVRETRRRNRCSR